MLTDDLEKELLEKEILRREIKYLQAFVPDVFFCANRIGYVQAWKYGNNFWLECNSALRTGYPLWEV